MKNFGYFDIRIDIIFSLFQDKSSIGEKLTWIKDVVLLFALLSALVIDENGSISSLKSA